MKIIDDYYLACLKILLENLRIRNVDAFLDNITLDNCAKLGSTYYHAAISAQIKEYSMIEADND